MVDQNIKEAFSNVKKDFEALKKDINNNKTELLKQKTLLKGISEKLELFLKRNDQIEDNEPFFKTSTGNKGVDNNRQQSTVNDGQWTTMMDNAQHPKKLSEGIKNLNQILTIRFNSLTDREFSTYMAIFEIEQEKGEVAYSDVSRRLNISESSVRTHVNQLLNKQVPLTRERFFNRKSSLSIKKGFKDPQMLTELLKLRQTQNTQTTLFDM